MGNCIHYIKGNGSLQKSDFFKDSKTSSLNLSPRSNSFRNIPNDVQPGDNMIESPALAFLKDSSRASFRVL